MVDKVKLAIFSHSGRECTLTKIAKLVKFTNLVQNCSVQVCRNCNNPTISYRFTLGARYARSCKVSTFWFRWCTSTWILSVLPSLSVSSSGLPHSGGGGAVCVTPQCLSTRPIQIWSLNCNPMKPSASTNFIPKSWPHDAQCLIRLLQIVTPSLPDIEIPWRQVAPTNFILILWENHQIPSTTPILGPLITFLSHNVQSWGLSLSFNPHLCFTTPLTH